MNAMTPYRRDSWPLRFQHEMEDLWQRLLAPTLTKAEGTLPNTWAPRVDLSETEKEVVVKADLPGVAPEDVELTFTDGILRLRGEKKEEKEEKENGFHKVERFSGLFYRELPLPAGIDPDKIVATAEKGVLTITAAKQPEAMDRKIKVQMKT
jgi:HSP20 family protein